MVLCLCNNVNELEWAAALDQHAHDFVAAQRSCGAGECCGSCLDSLRERVPLPEMLTLALVG
jgi:bacterioferritin-associated ferredoxin